MVKNSTLTLKQMVDQSNRGRQQILLELANLSPNLSFHWVARGANVVVHTLAKRFIEIDLWVILYMAIALPVFVPCSQGRGYFVLSYVIPLLFNK